MRVLAPYVADGLQAVGLQQLINVPFLDVPDDGPAVPYILTSRPTFVLSILLFGE